VPWTPAYTGHYCFLIRIESPDDQIRHDGFVPFDNNICQRNVQIIESGPSTSAVNVGNREWGSGYGSVILDSNDFPAGGSGAVTFTDPGLFERWQAAGGTASGGQIDPSTHSVHFDARSAGAGEGTVNLVLDRIPFEGEEVSPLAISFVAPIGALSGLASAEPPTLRLQQLVDGQPVGGSILRPQESILIYLPLVLKR